MVESNLRSRLDRVVELCLTHKVERLELIGSAASGRFDPIRSDYDFLVWFHPGTSYRRADAYFGLIFGLEDLLGRPVDLIEWGALTNRFLKEEIEESPRELIYDASGQKIS